MKRIALFLLCCCSIVVSAQQYISQSHRGSAQNHIYKISDKEALEIFRRIQTEKRWANEKYLHSFAGAYPVEKPFPVATTAGNYVVATARKNYIWYEFNPVHNVTLKIVSNNYDLALLIHDQQGNLLPGARVQINRKNIPWDARTKTYRLPRYTRSGIVQVSYNGVLNIFEVKQPPKQRTVSWWKKIFRRHTQYRPTYRFSSATPTEKKYKGFMAFSKPKYKPGDTLRMKAFIVKNDTKPVNEPLLLRLYNERTTLDTILTTLHPYRPGGYDYEMVLSDSLDLDLDDDYQFTLETLDSRKYTAAANETDDADDVYFAQRKVLMRGSFYYEEYELKSVHFTARTDLKKHTRGTPVALFLKATDENDLPIMDGRVTVSVTPGSVTQYHAPVVFVPQQLWTHEIALDMSGETKVTLPDSIFPAASMSYTIKAMFLNSNNESQQQSLEQEYFYDTDEISFTPKGDSVAVDFKRSGKGLPVPATLLLLNAKQDTVAFSHISLPAILPLQPYVNTIEVVAGGIRKSYKLADADEGAIKCNASRTRDSVFADIVNPNKVYFWYSIFAGNKLVAQGYDQQLSWKAATSTRSHYFVSVQYIWNDIVKEEQYVIPLWEKQLKVTINNPIAVFPGQTTRIGITVTDVYGHPVRDADVTAYAMTAKFNYTIPTLPFLGKRFPMRKMYSRLLLSDKEADDDHQQMNWDRWSKEMTLDSNAYYRFLHPDGIRYSTEPAKHAITQICPFVIEKGVIQFISHLKIDEQPVFFANTDLQSAYSFAVTPGKHKLEIRTFNKEIIIDNVYAGDGLKTYISIDTDKPDNGLRITRMPSRLTPLEMNLRKRYLVPFEVDPDHPFTYINQRGNIQWLNTRKYVQYSYLAGPLKGISADYTVGGSFAQAFLPEPGYTFNIHSGLVKQKSLPGKMDFPLALSKEWPGASIDDHVITENDMDSIWNDYQDNIQINQSLYSDNAQYKVTGAMVIASDTSIKATALRQLFLYRYDNPAFIRIYSGNTTRLDNLEPGAYQLLVLLKQKKYYVADSLLVKPGGYTFYQLRARKIMAPDSTSNALAKAIMDWKEYGSGQMSSYVAADFTTPFYDQYLDTVGFTNRVRGIITDGKNPLPGVTIRLKGTRYGSVTNAEGGFELSVSDNAVLSISFIGYEPQEIPLNGQSFLRIRLQASPKALNDVVVVGYSQYKRKSYVTASTTTYSYGFLQGTVAGVSIRGNNSLNNATPLIIIDGIPYDGTMDGIDPSLIKNITVLKYAEAIAIYGARAANGVVLVTSSKAGLLADVNQSDLPVESNSLRSNFRDDAFWQPRLRTNEKGETSFKVTFPDDITNWKTYALAFTDQGQTGSAQVQIKSFKPLSANLALPVFAVAGDSINIIGKVLNYGNDSTTLQRNFYTNGELTASQNIDVRNSRIDTFAVKAPLSGDSLSFKYTIDRRPDYFDGEYRAIPVFEKGVRETTGFFAALATDTSFHLPMDKDTGTVHLYASTGVLPVLLDEVEHLQRYEYLCNEQLASKLIGLLLEKQARKFLGQPFTGFKKITDLIRKLEQNKNKDGGWGWWDKSASAYWISQHVTQALLLAEKEGYKPNIDKAAIINYDVFLLNNADYTDKLTLLETLYQLDAGINFPAYLDTMQIAKGHLYDQFRLLHLKQRTHVSVSTAALLSMRQTTMMGNIYWGDESYRFFDNSIQLTLLAYKILRQEGGHDALLRSIRGWFLEKRQSGNWRNTYESAAILATIMPDVLQTSEIQPPVLRVNGQTISTFPYSSTLPGGQPLQISKQGGTAVYFTAWQQHWNPAPVAAEHQFSVSTRFLQQDTAVTVLTAGKVVTLEVTVEVKADADYIMVEIPIPAGCSYDSKNSGWQNNEVHREHFKNKVSIFSNHLNKGKYRFTVALMPRYTGYYHLNPAKAEMMYFPVFYGREGMKKVIIKGK